MSIYRGTGGSSTTTDETTINAVNQKAAEAATSATNAASSASSAATSASTANTKASQASTSADSAATSATQASASKDTAVSSATAAQAAQVAAETAQTAAEAAETNAILYGNMANTAAGSATSSATAAASSASAAQSTYADTLALGTTASNAATAAATSATEAESASAQAAGYASDASTSASNAASSANSAATYATSAQAAEANTIAIFDQFGDQYLGPKTTDPSVDNDGDALTEGDVYWNTTDNVLKFYNGTSWSAPEDVASTAASNALVSETNAATSATSAAGYASTASTAAASTAGSVTAAATSATNAANSATAAAASETSAEGHKDLAYTYWQNAASAVAYQDLAAIAASKAVTAVDVFVYDTSKDSDGGAWRKRTQHTSWYNETLNTATRGARKEFPAVAVIVAESNKVTIYDGDDPDLPMWMVFNVDGSSGFLLGYIVVSSISVLNGQLAVGGVDNYDGLYVLDFISEYGINYRASGISREFLGNVAGRSSAVYGANNSSLARIVNYYVNDVAMTVLPNAPIDSATGLPVPTIAVATDGGVSVIKDDGSVVDSSSTGSYRAVAFDGSDLYWAGGSLVRKNDVSLLTADGWNADLEYQASSGTVRLLPTGANQKALGYSDDIAVLSTDGLSIIAEEATNANSSVAYITSDYNTGWQHGDIKGTFLSDTTVETVGVDESTELVTNGTFDSDLSGWSAFNSNVTHNSSLNAINVQYISPSKIRGAFQTFTTVVGQIYTASVDVVENTSGLQAYLRCGNGVAPDAGLATSAPITSTGTLTVTFKATSTTSYIYLRIDDTAGTVTFDNASVKQTGNLVVNGTFDVDTSGWTETALTSSVSSGQATLTMTSTYGTFVQAITTVVGETYTITCDVVSETLSGNIYLGAGTTLGGWQIGLFTTSVGSNAYTFVATTTTTYVALYLNGSSSQTAVIDNFTARLASEDRSVNNNGLEVHGEIVKASVAAGSDLVAYSGFSNDNYLEQPYNSDLPAGGSDPFAIYAWVDCTANAFQTIVSFGENITGRLRRFVYDSTTGNVGMAFNGDNTYGSGSIIDTPDIKDTGWRFVAATCDGNDNISIYVDGVLYGTVSSPLLDQTSEQPLYIGEFAGGYWRGSLALVRISGTAPTAEQIARIYEDEKVLFQEGAQATLYGSSDAVTALAYDDTTELLHVGTSSGRSEFSGLRRVGNTTDAVGTAISASNGMVVEE